MIGVIRGTYNVQNKRKFEAETSFWRWLFLYLMLFGVEFNIDIIGAVTLRKLAFIMILLYIGRRGLPIGLPIRKDHITFGMMTAVVFAYALFIQYSRVENTSIPGNAAYPAIQILSQCLFLFLFPALCSQVFLNIDEFLTVQLAIISTQAVVAIVSRLNPSFRMFIYHHFVLDDGRLLDGMQKGVRVGILGGAGAGGSWIMFIGCVICAYYLLKIREMRYLFLYFVILFSMMFVGRTGLYMGLLLLALLIMYFLRWYTGLAVKIICMGLLGVLAIIGYILFTPDSYLKTSTINWVGEILLKGFGEGSTVQILVDMGVPPLSWETFWGTGIVNGATASGITSASDVGYIHTYMAFGVVGATIYYTWAYGFIAHELFKVQDRYVRWAATVFLLFTMAAELKEPFLRKTPNAMVLVLMLFLQNRTEKYIGKQGDRDDTSCIRYMPKL